MAGDWIKMRVDLGDDPAVIFIADLLGLTEDEIVGKLHKLWSWADRHATNGFAAAITSRWVDKYVSHSGFSNALEKVKWIEFTDAGVIFPNFDRHNGKSAKTRCDAAIRQRLSRKERDSGVTGSVRDGIPKPFRRAVYERDGYTCAYCGDESDKETETSKRAKLSIDHIIPSTRGGRSSMENLLTCCKDCNSEKNDRTPEEWGLIPTFLSDGVTYESQKICDTTVTRTLQKPLPEKRREEKILVLSKDNTDLPFSSPDFLMFWNNWEQHRIEIKKKLTPTTKRQQLAKLAEMGEARAIAALKHSLAGGWQGIFEPDNKSAKQLLSRDDRHPNELKEETDLSTLPVWDAMKDK